MTDFFMTKMGQRFYEQTMPALVKQIADLTEALKPRNRVQDILDVTIKEPKAFGERYAEFKGAIPLDLTVKNPRDRTTKPLTEQSNLWGSEIRRKLGIARGMLEEAKESAEDRGGDQHLVGRIAEVLLETADPWPEPHRVSRPSTDAKIAASTNRVIRDAHNTGEPSAMTMLRNLLARIHRDGGHHTEAVGVAKSFYDADIRVAYLNGQIDEPGTITRDNMYRADLKSLASETGETCHTDLGTRVRQNIAELKLALELSQRQARKFADNEGQAVKSEMAARSSELSLKQELDHVRKCRDEAGPPWLSDGVQALGAVQPNGEPLALNWSQVLTRIRQIRAERDSNMTAVLEWRRQMAHERSVSATRHELVLELERERDALKLTNAADRNKLDLVNKKLGIDFDDSYAHFHEQLNNALDDD